MKLKDGIQERVARELLQQPETYSFGGETYRIAPPTFGTLVAVSSLFRGLPENGIEAEKGKEFEAIVSMAHKYNRVPRIVALLILGAKEAEMPAKEKVKGNIFGRRSRRRNDAQRGSRTKLDALAEKLNYEASPSELKDAIAPLLERLELRDFFVLTTFLHRINVTKPTKVEEATAPGR